MKHLINGKEMDGYTLALQISYDNAMKELKDLREENKTLDEELAKANKLIKKLDKQVKTLIFERDMR